MCTFNGFPPPKNAEDVVKMLGDNSSKTNCVFRDIGSEYVKTIAVGIFDCIKRTWSLYSDNPKNNEPLVVLPLVLKQK